MVRLISPSVPNDVIGQADLHYLFLVARPCCFSSLNNAFAVLFSSVRSLFGTGYYTGFAAVTAEIYDN